MSPLFEFCWSQIFPWIKLSWHSYSVWEKPEWLVWFCNFTVRGYLPLIRQDSSTHMYGLAVYVNKELPFARDLSLKNSADSYLCFWLTLLHSVPCFFFLSVTFFVLVHVFYSNSSNIDEVLSINLSAKFLSFETLTSIIRTGLPILVELIGLVNYAIIFLSQMTLLRWLTFLLGFQTVILIVLLFWVYFYLVMLTPCLVVAVQPYMEWIPIKKTMAYLLLGSWSCCCLIFHWLLIKFKTGCSISLHSIWEFSCWLGWSSWSFERCSMVGYL